MSGGDDVEAVALRCVADASFAASPVGAFLLLERMAAMCPQGARLQASRLANAEWRARAWCYVEGTASTAHSAANFMQRLHARLAIVCHVCAAPAHSRHWRPLTNHAQMCRDCTARLSATTDMPPGELFAETIEKANARALVSRWFVPPTWQGRAYRTSDGRPFRLLADVSTQCLDQLRNWLQQSHQWTNVAGQLESEQAKADRQRALVCELVAKHGLIASFPSIDASFFLGSEPPTTWAHVLALRGTELRNFWLAARARRLDAMHIMLVERMAA